MATSPILTEQDGKLSRATAAILILLLGVIVYIGNAGFPGLLDDADASHAMVSWEMLQRHDAVILYMNGIRYLMKAPLHYWAVAVSYGIFGRNEFATRLPVALAMIGLAALVNAFGRRYFGVRAGLYSGLAVLTGAGFFLFTRIMIPEGIYALEFTAVFYLFLRGWTGSLDQRMAYWGAAAVTALDDLLKSHFDEVGYILYLRNPVDVVISAFSQRIKNGGTIGLSDFIAGRSENIDLHRDASRWQVAAGPFVVHVTGTRFRVNWDPQAEKLSVSVSEGRVQVTGGGIAIASLPFTVTPAPNYVRVATLAASDKAHDLFKSPSAVAVIRSAGRRISSEPGDAAGSPSFRAAA
jgi:hypothetical protein